MIFPIEDSVLIPVGLLGFVAELSPEQGSPTEFSKYLRHLRMHAMLQYSPGIFSEKSPVKVQPTQMSSRNSALN